MLPQISAFPNKAFYDGELLNAQKMSNARSKPLLPTNVFHWIRDEKHKLKYCAKPDPKTVNLMKRRFGPLVWLDTCHIENLEEDMGGKSRRNMKEVRIICKHVDHFWQY